MTSEVCCSDYACTATALYGTKLECYKSLRRPHRTSPPEPYQRRLHHNMSLIATLVAAAILRATLFAGNFQLPFCSHATFPSPIPVPRRRFAILTPLLPSCSTWSLLHTTMLYSGLAQALWRGNFILEASTAAQNTPVMPTSQIQHADRCYYLGHKSRWHRATISAFASTIVRIRRSTLHIAKAALFLLFPAVIQDRSASSLECQLQTPQPPSDLDPVGTPFCKR